MFNSLLPKKKTFTRIKLKKEAMTQEKKPSDVIDASPTKDFFISMLVRDLSLNDVIGDLVDNSVDSARSFIQNDDYELLKIEITLSKNEFTIKDNCGGIRVNVARDYAFRFGRPKGASEIKGSIGQFGIGMKRALFKIGRMISITSIADNSSFELELDVDAWEKDKEWDFRFKEFKEDQNNISKKRGTYIKVSNLKEDASNEFNDSGFIKSLGKELELEHVYPLSKGLTITINGIKLTQRNLDLLRSDEIESAFYRHTFSDNVTVEILAGIGESKLEDGGWYIFGNQRLILGPETSGVSGWTGGRTSDGGPKYHGQYQRFRGYVFFEADNAALLPWNTSKNGVDIDSPKYKFVRQRMIELMKPIISFLNQMKEEREGDVSPDDLFLQRKVEEATSVSVSTVLQDRFKEVVPIDEPAVANPIEEDTTRSEINTADVLVESELPTNMMVVFTAPSSPEKKNKNDTVKISYSKPKKDVDLIKKNLNVSSNKEVGEATFDYYYDAEI